MATDLNEDVVEFVAGMVALFADRRTVRKALREVLDRQVSSGATTTYIKAAKVLNSERMSAVMSDPKAAERAMAVYVECIKDEDASWKEKMLALDGYNQMLMLAKHKPRTDISVPAEEAAAKIRELLGAIYKTVQ